MPELTRRRLLTAAGAAATAAFAAEFLPRNIRRALASGPPRGALLPLRAAARTALSRWIRWLPR
jgi:hypothetical protein